MANLVLVLGDQLSRKLPSLRAVERDRDLVLMAEVHEEATYVAHHKKKIAFVFSAMRHFAQELKSDGYTVRYVKLGDQENAASLKGEVARALDSGRFDRVVVTKPGEFRLLQDMLGWSDAFGCDVELLEDDRFICGVEEFASWAEGRKELRMEYFYREMRKKTGLLMDGREPVGGQWNYDQENRRRLPDSVQAPPRLTVEPDAVTKQVLDLVSSRFDNHFGDLEPFWYAVTRADAEALFEAFATDILPCFGDYQDAMAKGEPWLWHSIIALYLNVGLLDPLEVCQRAEKAFRVGQAPLNAVEGFVRQILGWREYVRGLYWLKMPEYKSLNVLEARRRLPDLYWTGETDMTCMADAISQTKRHAYAHHIQRLMITGNFALIAGLRPDDVNDWYMRVYADAYEWVELPNTHGMALYADGGIMASKPYAASANYINKMSDYCGDCHFDHKAKSGERACPFNLLYWDFLARNRDRLKSNPRIGMILRNLDRMGENEVDRISRDADAFLNRIGATPTD